MKQRDGRARKFNIPPGDYMTPKPASPADMRVPGLSGQAHARARDDHDGPAQRHAGMSAQLVQWLIFCLVVSTFAAYLASRTLAPASEYLKVSQNRQHDRVHGYILAQWSQVVWYRQSVSADDQEHDRRAALRSRNRRHVRLAVAK
jgi:hypothetical protein